MNEQPNLFSNGRGPHKKRPPKKERPPLDPGVKKIKNLEKKAEEILAAIPDARNSDVRLMIEIWKKHFPHLLFTVDGELAVKLNNLYHLTREDNIKRVRAKIQNEKHKYVPTIWKIAKDRHMAEPIWRMYALLQDREGE